jgi:hypothetical protein
MQSPSRGRKHALERRLLQDSGRRRLPRREPKQKSKLASKLSRKELLARELSKND